MNEPTLLCQYASKPCFQARARKENGELHKLCEFHRAKANEAQQRWYERRQQETVSTAVGSKQRRQTTTHKPVRSRKRNRAKTTTTKTELQQRSTHSEAAVSIPHPFSDEDLTLLDTILNSGDDSDHYVAHTQDIGDDS